jgi:hypothetical protein
MVERNGNNLAASNKMLNADMREAPQALLLYIPQNAMPRKHPAKSCVLSILELPNQ